VNKEIRRKEGGKVCGVGSIGLGTEIVESYGHGFIHVP
jgi:hypothetical protein